MHHESALELWPPSALDGGDVQLLDLCGFLLDLVELADRDLDHFPVEDQATRRTRRVNSAESVAFDEPTELGRRHTLHLLRRQIAEWPLDRSASAGTRGAPHAAAESATTASTARVARSRAPRDPPLMAPAQAFRRGDR